jgi:hypothetical protein
MNNSNRTHQVTRTVRQIARRAASVVAECNYAQSRLTQLRLGLGSHSHDTSHRSR